MKNKIIFLIFLFVISCSSTPTRGPASFQSCLITMNNIINYQTYSGKAGDVFSKAQNLNELEASYANESLITIQERINEAEIKANNENLLKLLSKDIEFPPLPNKKNFITKDEADVIFKAMDNSTVHKNHDCYDPKGNIGFCFGRATIAHMEAIIRNVHPDAIRKIWIVGDMSIWAHHVATMIKVKNGWVVLDTNLGKVVTPNEWLSTFMPYKSKNAKEIMTFVTQAGRFGPYDTKSYNALDLFNTDSLNYNKAQDYYRGYFHDYFEDLDNVSTPPLLKQ